MPWSKITFFSSVNLTSLQRQQSLWIPAVCGYQHNAMDCKEFAEQMSVWWSFEDRYKVGIRTQQQFWKLMRISVLASVAQLPSRSDVSVPSHGNQHGTRRKDRKAHMCQQSACTQIICTDTGNEIQTAWDSPSERITGLEIPSTVGREHKGSEQSTRWQLQMSLVL